MEGQNDERDALRDELAAAYELTERNLATAAGALRYTAIADPDRLLDDDRLLEASHEELPWHPYWVHAGAAACGLAQLLTTLPLEGKRVLDLGCGLGVTSVAALTAGASVVACDHAPPALQFTRLNTRSYAERVHVRRFDWRYDSFGEQFDLIVGSDVLYNRADLPFLDRLWRTARRADGLILLADPRRPLTGGLLNDVVALGWRVRRRLSDTPEGEARIALICDGLPAGEWEALNEYGRPE